jgi:hypothetical protein
MSNLDDDRSSDDGVYQPESATTHRPSRRRRQAVVGAVGLTALLGAGAYVITAQVTDRNKSTVTRDAGALAPMATPATPASASSTASAKQTNKPSTSPEPSKSMTVEERIKAARQAAAKDGYPVQRPLTAAPGVAAQSGPINTRSETRENGSLRVVTAKFDLTGQRELLWAADKGKPVGNARCTQKFHFSNNKKGYIRPNMLLCWRTSAARSVAVVLIDYGGKPSTVESAKIIDGEWAKLG